MDVGPRQVKSIRRRYVLVSLPFFLSPLADLIAVLSYAGFRNGMFSHL